MQKHIPRPARDDADVPLSAGMAALAEHARGAEGDILVVARNEVRSEAFAEALRVFLPHEEVLVFPQWDCAPYDRAPPSRERMGRRVAVLSRLQIKDRPRCIVVTSPMGLLQRVAPPGAYESAILELAPGDEIAPDTLRPFLERIGYLVDDRVDEPGEVALRGAVIDIFPPAEPLPLRIDHDGGKVTELWTYDPLSQMTAEAREVLRVLPASEIILPEAEEEDPSAQPSRGLPHCFGPLSTLVEHLEGTRIVFDTGAGERGLEDLGQIVDAHETAVAFRGAGGTRAPIADPQHVYLSDRDWKALVADGEPLPVSEARPAPKFVLGDAPAEVLRDFLDQHREQEYRIALVAPSRRILGKVLRRAGLGPSDVQDADGLDGLATLPEGAVAALEGNIEAGFVDERAKVALITAADVLGRRGGQGASAAPTDVFMSGDAEMRPGDLVVHIDHGIARLEGIETVDAGEGAGEDVVALAFADEAKLMVPAREIGKIWRYGGDAEAVRLDKLGGSTWPRRKAELARDLASLAERLLVLASERRAMEAPVLEPDRTAFRRFVQAFPFRATPDQESASEAVLADLRSGRPMDRLVCGDVGYGKTEVALRAAAATILAGKQVAVAAPTTVLVRQHVETFRRRFAELGVEVAELSRLAGSAEALAVKEGLASGDTRLVIGTHALAGKTVTFADLGLLIVDEEHRFGTKDKEALRALGSGVHVLTLTATPIPRTLETSLVGIRELSIIATPPAPRRPIRTLLTPFDAASVRSALTREQARGGQSFVVCPRIEDIAPMTRRLAEIVPELDLAVVHGKMKAAEVDRVMIDFAEGRGDVLLATNIIESGLDVPRANTILVWRADRFGVAQLHQLRGRVGRGRRRGTAYLLTDPDRELAPSTEKRLRTLEAFDRLGSGFALSARDLDHRGAGDLVGAEQTGHLRMIGADLYQSLLARALKQARDEEPEEEWTSEVHLGLATYVPETYIPEPELRMGLHVRLARIGNEEEVATIEEEIHDRFGPLPEPVGNLLAVAELARECRRAGVARLEAGPAGVALTLRYPRDGAERVLREAFGSGVVERNGRFVASIEADGAGRLSACLSAVRSLQGRARIGST